MTTAATHRRDRWDQGARIPLIVLGIGFVIAYSVQVLGVHLPNSVTSSLLAFAGLVWLAFVVDYVVRLSLTPHGHRFEYIASTPIDFLSMFLPIFRALRVVDLVRGLTLFKNRSGNAQRTMVLFYAASYAVIYVYFIALATLQAERRSTDAKIQDFPDAVWWAFETISTVGYGDMYPVTGLGRFYAILLMIGGIAIVGVISGTIVSYIGEKVRGHDPRHPHPAAHPEPAALPEPAEGQKPRL